jgi:ring-1,2-phenylacetyl-CoA epoxidase subunit PaaB
MALLNARDVFARRPQALAMQVVPADLIYTKTLEELEDANWANDEVTGKKQSYLIFAKPFEQAPCQEMGDIESNSPQSALKIALQTYSEQKALWWWVLPASAIHATAISDKDPMFSPALEKTYKNQSEYHTVTLMRELHEKGKLES